VFALLRPTDMAEEHADTTFLPIRHRDVRGNSSGLLWRLATSTASFLTMFALHASRLVRSADRHWPATVQRKHHLLISMKNNANFSTAKQDKKVRSHRVEHEIGPVA
jgi:hypothetical protein